MSEPLMILFEPQYYALILFPVGTGKNHERWVMSRKFGGLYQQREGDNGCSRLGVYEQTMM